MELFSDPRSPGAVMKAKEAVLYDELIFEVGLLDVFNRPKWRSHLLESTRGHDAGAARSKPPCGRRWLPELKPRSSGFPV